MGALLTFVATSQGGVIDSAYMAVETVRRFIDKFAPGAQATSGHQDHIYENTYYIYNGNSQDVISGFRPDPDVPSTPLYGLTEVLIHDKVLSYSSYVSSTDLCEKRL